MNKRLSKLAKKYLLVYSRKYRCVLQANHLKLKELYENNKESNEYDRDLVETFKKIGIHWHLCEMLLIDIHQTGILLNKLITWIAWHFDELNSAFDQIIQSESPSEHSEYWNVVYCLVFKREISHAKNLLYLHPNMKSDDFISILEQLEKIPLYTNEQVLYEFYHIWQVWNYRCENVYEKHVFTDENLIRLAMVAMLLYTDPTVKESELTVLTIECLKHFYGNDYQSEFDTILFHL